MDRDTLGAVRVQLIAEPAVPRLLLDKQVHTDKGDVQFLKVGSSHFISIADDADDYDSSCEFPTHTRTHTPHTHTHTNHR